MLNVLTVGLDVGSTTVKAAVSGNGEVRWQDYKRHNTKQAEMVLEFLGRMKAECALAAGRGRILLPGSRRCLRRLHARAARRGQDGPGSRRGVGGSREAASAGELRLGDRGRRHEDAVLH